MKPLPSEKARRGYRGNPEVLKSRPDGLMVYV